MSKKITIILFINLLAIISCKNDPIVLEPESLGLYYLKCRIAPSVTQAGAVLGFINPESIPIDTKGANVIISGEGQQVKLVEIKPGFYQDSDALLTIKPKGEYKIKATLPDGSVLSGKSFVPGPFNIIKNSNNDTLEYIVKTTSLGNSSEIFIPPKISWTKSQHALSYTMFFKESKSSVDTTVYLPETVGTNYFRKHPDATSYFEKVGITITAYDSSRLPYHNSYGDYHTNWKDPYGENFRIDQIGQQLNLVPGQNNNIVGGSGYLSSSYTIKDSVIIRYKRELKIK